MVIHLDWWLHDFDSIYLTREGKLAYFGLSMRLACVDGSGIFWCQVFSLIKVKLVLRIEDEILWIEWNWINWEIKG